MSAVMTLGPASLARLQDVMPYLAAQIVKMQGILALDNPPLQIIVSAGMRTWKEQNGLWQLGRNDDGTYIDPIHHTGVVTNAKGGHSWHNFGCAVDCEPDDPTKAGVQIDWNAAHPQWKRMEQVGMSLGLTSGANWIRLVDAPHFQYTGRFPENAPDDEARQIYMNEGAEAFWQEVSP